MVKVALLGCGRWGQNHLRVLSSFREKGIIDYITVVDTSKSARDAAILADETKSDFDNVDADLVIIATPSNLHASQARDLLSKGYHVLVEKPLGCSESEAAQVLASAREFGRIIGVGLLLRFHPAVALANQLINNGELGRLVSLRFVRRTTRNAPEDGNVIEALGVHAIDLMCNFMSESEPSAVNVEGDEIEARIALEFPHGIEAIIDVAWQASQERRSVTLVGSIATLRFDLDVHDRVELISNDGEKEIFCESTNSPLEAELENIITGINNFNSGYAWAPTPDYGAALRGVRWTERAIQALPISRPH
ncbi:MAG: Gfo/Idh/MocA family oxidoreductase [Candidatus Poseidoniaceae archaeon]|nr:Gfo/Idh/MocA family oxidoreductase [Candidatus Poseidoniaceae archaeon]